MSEELDDEQAAKYWWKKCGELESKLDSLRSRLKKAEAQVKGLTVALKDVTYTARHCWNKVAPLPSTHPMIEQAERALNDAAPLLGAHDAEVMRPLVSLLRRARRWLHSPGMGVDAVVRAESHINHERLCESCRDASEIDAALAELDAEKKSGEGN